MKAYRVDVSTWVLTVPLIMAVSLSILLVSTAQAKKKSQRYSIASLSRAKEFVEDKNACNKMANFVRKTVSGSENYDDNKDKIDQWYKNYIFPLMTRYQAVPGVTDNPLGDLGKHRDELLRAANKAKSAAFRNDLQKRILSMMPRIAQMNFHPAVRYNAMLIVGALNASEGTTMGGERTAPDPKRAAMSPLIGELRNAEQIDAVRIAALIGVHRHVELDRFRRPPFSSKQKATIAEVVIPFVKSVEPPADRSFAAHNWIRRRAIEILAMLDPPDKEGAIASVFGEIFNDKKATRSLRLTAGEAIGATQLPPQSVSDPSALAAVMARFAVDACREEMVKLEELIELERRDPRYGSGGSESMPMMDLPGGMGMMMGSEDFVPGGELGRQQRSTKSRIRKPVKTEGEILLELSRRRLLTTLAAVQRGLGGSDGKGGILAHAKNEPHLANINDLFQSVSNTIVACDTIDIETRDLLADLTDRTSTLDVNIARVQSPVGDRVEEDVAATDDEFDGPESTFIEDIENLDTETSDVFE